MNRAQERLEQVRNRWETEGNRWTKLQNNEQTTKWNTTLKGGSKKVAQKKYGDLETGHETYKYYYASHNSQRASVIAGLSLT